MNRRQQAIGLLRFTRETALDVLKGFPEDKFTYQRTPADNHALWAMGHIALTDAWFASMLGIAIEAIPKEWNGHFGQGSKPHSDASKYPPAAEVRQRFDSIRAALLNWLESAPEAALETSLKEKTGGFALDVLDGMCKEAWHEGWHFGQVATLRKDLKLPSAFGG